MTKESPTPNAPGLPACGIGYSSFRFGHSLVIRASSLVILCLSLVSSALAQTNSVPPSYNTALSTPDMSTSLLRVMGALVLVLGLFFAGVWMVKNWQRLAVQRGGRAPKLNVLEVRSLGGRQAIYVVGYEQERFLLASSPAGVNFLTHLPAATGEEVGANEAKPNPSFPQALAQVLKGK
jgi:flagellar biogenesis protein FliO